MILAAVAAASLLAPPRPREPDVFIAIASMGVAPGIREAETVLVYQPGVLAAPLGRAGSMRPFVAVRAATVTGRSASVGVQFVWVRPR